jgi:hypothetical protein
MSRIFEMIQSERKGEGPEVLIGIRMTIAGSEILVPVSPACTQIEELEQEVRSIQRDLETSLETARERFKKSKVQSALEITPEMGPEAVWNILSRIGDDELFMKGFNSLEENQRKQVSEYVLTQCNIFSGRASFFSSRYDHEKDVLE